LEKQSENERKNKLTNFTSTKKKDSFSFKQTPQNELMLADIPSNFSRESPRHKTTPHGKTKFTLNDKVEKLSNILKSTAKYSKTTPLTIISQLYNFQMINSSQRSMLKELIMDSNKMLFQYLDNYKQDGSIQNLYDNLYGLLNR